ncbi:hypothetical protein INT45_006019 [Circinella minor]|uniref:Uncharacterized protein n=1 Tax=Circinella minor TaxID=1195481 RepID=A0A8H7SDR9_9FUNG|nr:hypothetical protein INT45_006019 [Circinella minor]
MVNISSSLSVLALSFIVVQAVPIQNEMENMIHAQSYSELKHDTFVPMQRLGQDHLPVRKYEQGHKEVSAAEMPFRPIMVVPLPASVTEQQQQEQGQRVSASASINNNGKMMDSKMNNDDAMMQVPTNNNINKNIYDNKVVGMDDQGKIQTVQLPATIHMPMASASASSLPISASTSPSSVAPMAKVSIPMMAPSASSIMMKNRQNLVGMDDMGKLETLVIPMTTNADAAPTQF